MRGLLVRNMNREWIPTRENGSGGGSTLRALGAVAGRVEGMNADEGVVTDRMTKPFLVLTKPLTAHSAPLEDIHTAQMGAIPLVRMLATLAIQAREFVIRDRGLAFDANDRQPGVGRATGAVAGIVGERWHVDNCDGRDRNKQEGETSERGQHRPTSSVDSRGSR